MSITREFLRHPMLTGAVAASSARLAVEVTAGLGLDQVARVVELGPGTGVFTDAVLALLPPEACFTAFEVNPRLAAGSAAMPYRRFVLGSVGAAVLWAVSGLLAGCMTGAVV